MGNLRGWKIRLSKLKAQLLKGRKDDGAHIAHLFLLRREAEEFCNEDMQRGEWLKEGDGAWNFNADPTDFGFGAMIRHNETYKSLLNVERMRYVVGQGTPVLLSYQFPAWILGPLGRRSLPISVTTTADIPVMLSVREDNFVIGRKRFVVDGSQDECARREYQRLVVGRRMTCNISILEEIFNEQEMMVLHRVDLEMDLADTLQEQADRRYESVAREVILVEDDDENMTDAQTGGGNDHAPNQDPSQLPLIQPPTAPSETEALTEDEVHLHFLAAWALPLTQQAPALPEAATLNQNEGQIVRRWTMETPMDFWEGLMGDELVLPDGVEPNRAVVEGERRTTETICLVGDGGVAAAHEENDASSTGSCPDLEMEVPPPVSVPDETHRGANAAPEPGNELLAAFDKFLGNETIRSQVPQPPQPVVASGSGMSVSEKCQDQTTVVVTAKLGLTIDCGGMGAPGPQDVTPKNPNSSSDESGADGGFN
ncbi:unnamed protein product [Brassica oleracea var. botrytis]